MQIQMSRESSAWSLMSMCSKEKDEEGRGRSGNGTALGLPKGIKTNGDFPLQLTGSEMVGPTAACIEVY